MKYITCLIVFLYTTVGLQAQIQPQVNLAIKGYANGLIPLVSEEGFGVKLYHPGWLKGEKRNCFISANSEDLTSDWQDFSLSFTPQKTGTVEFILSARIYKLPDKKRAKIYTVYDQIKITGGQLENADFEQTDDIGGFIAWHSRWGTQPLKTDLGESAKVWGGNDLIQEMKVTANTLVTIQFKAKAFAPFIPPKVKKAADSGPTRRDIEDAEEGMFPPLWYPLVRSDAVAKINKRFSKAKSASEVALDHKLDENIKNISRELQKRLDQGEKYVKIPNGTYKLTSLTVPADVTLCGSENTVIVFDSNQGEMKTIVTLAGNNTTLSYLKLQVSDALLTKLLQNKESRLIEGDKLSNVRFDHVDFSCSDKQYVAMRLSRQRPGTRSLMGVRWMVCLLTNSHDIEMSNSNFKNFSLGLRTTHCSRVSFHDNVGVNGQHNMLSFYHGSEYVRFFNNWFSHVKHPLVWDGGDCSPHNKRLVPSLPRDVMRNMLPDDNDYAIHMTGTYEVFCHNNYGEYGKTLLWGRKGRRVIITANSSKYQYDMAYDAEGCEEVIVANNIATNSKAAGIGSFYHNDKTVITGNMIAIHDIGDDIYKGQFVRMHSAHGTQSGKTIISGNLFVSHLKEPRFLKIDQCRNLVVSNNKFVNGGILTNPYGGGKITINGNTFINQLPNEPTLVIINKIIKELTFRNNTFINENTDASTESSPAIDINFEVTRKLASEKPFVVSNKVFRQIDGNSFRGWKIPLAFTNMPKGSNNARVILVNNIYDGQFSIPVSMKNMINKNNIKID